MNTSKSALSYKADVVVFPNWGRIIRSYFPEIKTDKEAYEFVEKFCKKFKIDEKESLYRQRVVLLEVHDAVSGLNLIWSHKYHAFLHGLELQGSILSSKDGKLDEEFEDKLNEESTNGDHRFNSITISPNEIRAGETLSKIPYHDIVNLLLRIQQETQSANRQIKKFPKAFQDIFDRDAISYIPDLDTHGGDLNSDTSSVESKWLEEVGMELFQQRVTSHKFETPYFSTSLSLDFFSPNDIRPWNEIADSEWDHNLTG